MSETAARVGGKVRPKALTGGIYDLWVSSCGRFPEAVDFYTRLSAASGGNLLLLEGGGPLVASLLSRDRGKVAHLGLFCDSRKGPGEAADDITREWESFRSGEPLSLILAPLGALELFWRKESLRSLLANVRENLADEGRFVFDARRWSTEGDKVLDGAPRLVADAQTMDGVSTMLWETWRPTRGCSGVVELGLGIETLGADGSVGKKRYGRLLLGKLDPEELRGCAQEAGLVVDGSFGGFDFEPLTADSRVQLFVLRKGKGEARP